jgi:hypothetical protein
MAFVGPFDGPELAEPDPVRAAAFGDVAQQRVAAVTVTPAGNSQPSKVARLRAAGDGDVNPEVVVTRAPQGVTRPGSRPGHPGRHRVP